MTAFSMPLRYAVCLPTALAVLSVVLGGCAVGPDFKKPEPPHATEFTNPAPVTTASSDDAVAGKAQALSRNVDISGDWWTLFHSNTLDALVEKALAKNPDLKSAQAALDVARENALAQRGAFFPNVAAGFSASHQRQAGTIAPTPSSNAFQYSLYTPQLNISYVPDVFGLNRRTLESVQAQREAIRFQMIAAQTTLSTNVVVTAIAIGSLQTQIAATRDIMVTNTHSLDIVRRQFAKGYVGKLEVAAQESQLAQVTASLPPLLKQLAQQQHLLAVLAGDFPSDAPQDDFSLSTLQLPLDLPLSLPSQLVAQRPDVLQAQATMHASSAQVGIATANRLPNIELTGNAGSTALAIGKVFSAGTSFWGVGAALTAPIFQGGTLLHQQRAAEAGYVQAAEQYRSTVLTAMQNVADTLVALQQDADALRSAAQAADAAKTALELSQRQVQSGYAAYLVLLSAEQAYQQTRITLVQAQASRFADTAALFQALGGGWWHREELLENHQ